MRPCAIGPGLSLKMTALARPAVVLDAEHRYSFNGVRKPGFTEIAKAMGVIEGNAFYTEAGRAEGDALHLWLNFLGQGNEPDIDPDPRIAGRVEGIRKFMRESGFSYLGGERCVYAYRGDFCCKPDLWGEIGGRPSIVEAKRGAKLPWHRLQTAAQYLALNDSGEVILDRYALYLKDGDYRLEAHRDKEDMRRWEVIANAYHAASFYK